MKVELGKSTQSPQCSEKVCYTNIFGFHIESKHLLYVQYSVTIQIYFSYALQNGKTGLMDTYMFCGDEVAPASHDARRRARDGVPRRGLALPAHLGDEDGRPRGGLKRTQT